MKIELEDLPIDIINKAQLGLGLTDHALAQMANVKASEIYKVKNGEIEEALLAPIAEILKLQPQALLSLHQKKWYPKVSVPSFLKPISSRYGSMTVQCYLVYDRFASKATLFDTGTDAHAVLNILASKELHLDAIMLTHTHPDHIEALDQIVKENPGVSIFAPANEPYPESIAIEEGVKFRMGKLSIYPLNTPGHSPGGTSYLIEGEGNPVIICGDALFAGSMGRVPKEHYQASIDNVKQKLLSYPTSTLLCPGHGPITTVADELEHNPFFAK